MMTEMTDTYLKGLVKEKISGYLRAAVGEKAMLSVWTEQTSVTVSSEQVVQQAQNQPMEEDTNPKTNLQNRKYRICI